jgi:hypothetical protein
MALDTERRALGVKRLLHRLRGSAPRPLSAEDELQGLIKPDEEEGLTSEDERSATPSAPKKSPLMPKGGTRGL